MDLLLFMIAVGIIAVILTVMLIGLIGWLTEPFLRWLEDHPFRPKWLQRANAGKRRPTNDNGEERLNQKESL